MGFLANKRILITGLISNRSIAYGIAQAMHREGAELAFTYVVDKLKDRVVEMANEFGSSIVIRCDVGSDDEINNMAVELKTHWPEGFDGFVHSIGFAPREALTGDFLDAISRESYQIAHDISAYSFPALAKATRDMLRPHSALLTLTYLGAERAMPSYNVMGMAKASLEAGVRYLSYAMGPQNIRVNGISAGPIKTLAAAGIGGFSKILHHVAETAPLKRGVTIEEVGNVAAFLMSDLASGVTGEITYVDAGYNIVAPISEE
ncbi:enoyl-[acyl-carrier protein] reductase I [Chitinivorax tropicus]|uniref:Enoyl-[acyl-carrier-protein] reductase [NADH] n=1 Tax=Chitinivorax tropicus TaxID=714531 RepID=A0A840MLL0_9PROT|nr:SDR family oxidoreductase [Chitinivorax tropicus]MBB5020044.1 enoyl-[acyl-carrier protein] reductase I [Chitinivorax tropicus]